MSSKRTLILSGVKTVINALYGSAIATPILRTVARGPYKPGSYAATPAAIICDGGQRAKSQADSDMIAVLSVQVILDLEANWDRATALDDWSDRVDAIIRAVLASPLTGCDIEQIDYVSDEPWEALLASGASRAVWIIDFDVSYYRDLSV